MNHTNNNSTGQPKARGAFSLPAAAIGLAALAMLGASARASDMYQPSGITAGGVPAQATLNAPVPTPTNCTFSWYGMRGWSTVLGSTNVSGPYTNSIISTEAAEYAWSVTATNPDANSWFFILAQTNYYAGSGACSGCHGDKYVQWSGTLHANAYSNCLPGIGQGANASCLPCHTVGFGQPSGYINTTQTPNLENVGCEDCHGPAGWHKNSDHDIIRPAITVAAEVCGGCHNSHNPQYTEWTNSPHATVVPDFASGISDSFSGEKNLMNCGPCHSGATRLAMLADYQNRMKGITNQLVLPSAHDGTNYAQTCVVCHDPHTPVYLSTNYVYATNITYVTNISGNWGNYHTNIYANATNVTTTATNIAKIQFQLRNPMNSTNYFTFFTAAPTVVTAYTNFSGVVTYTTNYVNDNFLSQYDPNVHICAQCHNSRGARWDGLGRTWTGSNFVTSTPSWSRPPHNSPQYNILIGIIQPDYLNVNSSGVATNMAATHSGFPSGVLNSRAFNTNQCATCHVPLYSINGTTVTPVNTAGATNVTGHTFALDTQGCALGGCHTGGVPNWQSTQTNTILAISNIVNLLNRWATSNGPALFGANYSRYQQNAWEYSTPGSLGNPSYPGPTNTDQPKLPASIMQARFDLYMVQNDGSFGVHNPTYIPFLLNDASNKVLGAIISATNNAYFTASANAGYVPFTVSFQSWGSGITNYSWNFGDGGTTNIANPTYTYAGRGTNTVTLTVITTNGTTTYSRANYIKTYNQPVVAFTASALTGPAPLTVTFTNTSTGTDDVSAWRWTVKSGTNVSTNAPVFAYTYTAAGTNSVSLRATTPVGNITTTSNNFIIVTQ